MGVSSKEVPVQRRAKLSWSARGGGAVQYYQARCWLWLRQAHNPRVGTLQEVRLFLRQFIFSELLAQASASQSPRTLQLPKAALHLYFFSRMSDFLHAF